jgi:hypothetical protein
MIPAAGVRRRAQRPDRRSQRRRPQTGQADPRGPGQAHLAKGIAAAAAVVGVLLAIPSAGQPWRSPWACSRWDTPTTFGSREPPGRGCRSPCHPTLPDLRLARRRRLAATDLGRPAADCRLAGAALAVSNATVDVERGPGGRPRNPWPSGWGGSGPCASTLCCWPRSGPWRR